MYLAVLQDAFTAEQHSPWKNGCNWNPQQLVQGLLRSTACLICHKLPRDTQAAPHHPTPLITGELTQCVTRRGVDKAFLWQQHYTIGHCFQTEKITRRAISLHTSHPFPRRLGINRLTHVVLHTDYFDSTLWKYKRHVFERLTELNVGFGFC